MFADGISWNIISGCIFTPLRDSTVSLDVEVYPVGIPVWLMIYEIRSTFDTLIVPAVALRSPIPSSLIKSNPVPVIGLGEMVYDAPPIWDPFCCVMILRLPVRSMNDSDGVNVSASVAE